MNETWFTGFKVAVGDIISFFVTIIKSETFISFIFGALIAALALLGSNLLYRRWLRPKLKITKERESKDSPYIRVLVKNKGKTAAKNCVGKITLSKVSRGKGRELEEITKDDLKEGEFYFTMQPDNFIPITRMSIHWANIVLGGGAITINAKDDEALDVAVLRKKEEIFHIDVFSEDGDRGPNRCRLIYYEDGEYRGRIYITAANANPQEINFKMKMANDNTKIELFKIIKLFENLKRLWKKR